MIFIHNSFLGEMGLVDLMKHLETKDPPKQLLSSVDLEGIVQLIKDKKATNIITMAGAGISTCKKFSVQKLSKLFTHRLQCPCNSFTSL